MRKWWNTQTDDGAPRALAKTGRQRHDVADLIADIRRVARVARSLTADGAAAATEPTRVVGTPT